MRFGRLLFVPLTSRDYSHGDFPRTPLYLVKLQRAWGKPVRYLRCHCFPGMKHKTEFSMQQLQPGGRRGRTLPKWKQEKGAPL